MEKNRRKIPWLPVAGIAVLVCAAGLFWLSQNPTSVAQWALKKAMPRAGIAVDAVRFGEPGEIIFENFVLPDPLTGKPLLRLERGRLVFTFFGYPSVPHRGNPFGQSPLGHLPRMVGVFFGNCGRIKKRPRTDDSADFL